MTKRILLSGVLMLAVAGCGGSGGGSSSPISNCNASQGSIAPLLKEPSTSPLKTGSYRFQRADYVQRIQGVSMLVSQSYSLDAKGSTHEANILCPAGGQLAKSVGNTRFESTVPDVLLVNDKGEIEIPNTFSLLTIGIYTDGDQTRVATKSPKSSSLQSEGVTSDLLRKAPGLKIVPVNNGFVLITKPDGFTEIYSFFSLVKVEQRSEPSQGSITPPAPRPPAPPEKAFSKEECLAQKNVNLGKYPKEIVRFSNDCSWLYVKNAVPTMRISAVGFPTGGRLDDCSMYSTARVVLLFSSAELNVLRDLQKLNPGMNMNVDPMNMGVRISHLKQVGKSRMMIPAINVADDPRDSSRSVVTVNGGLSAAVDLDNEMTCRYYKDLLDYSTNEQKVIDMIMKEFAIEFGGR